MTADAHLSDTAPNGADVLAQMRPALFKYFLRKTGSPQEAEDLTQDVLIRTLLHSDWKSFEQAKGYLFRAAVNRLHDRYRERQAHGSTVEWNEAEEYLGTESPPESGLIVREELNQIFHALEGMNERTRTVLILVKVEQMKAAVVAEMLGISVRAVNKHLAKAVEVLIRLRKRQEWLR